MKSCQITLNTPILVGVLFLALTFRAIAASQAKSVAHQALRAYDEGQRAIFHRDYDRAAAAFQRAVELDSSLADAHYYLGMVYGSQQKWQSATRAFQQAAIADPDYLEAHYKLGDTYLKVLAQASKAIPPLQKAVEMDPHHAESRRLLGIAYFRQQHLDKSIHELRRAAALDPSRLESYYTLGLAYFQRGEFETASTHFKRIIEQDSFHCQSIFEPWPTATAALGCWQRERRR